MVVQFQSYHHALSQRRRSARRGAPLLFDFRSGRRQQTMATLRGLPREGNIGDIIIFSEGITVQRGAEEGPRFAKADAEPANEDLGLFIDEYCESLTHLRYKPCT
jgi:hypothetical protein